ncbi:PulJ/GspJ family protein [Kineococcus auxinigenes]|uniref:PulJ/GspJ family protein n=1 Tax=unclassified Kineococcus TaxID=2621656 RepID=UPI003D7D6995
MIGLVRSWRERRDSGIRDGGIRDGGLTLAETVVSMGVGSMLLAGVTALTVAQIRTIDAAEKRSTTAQQTANALDLISKQVRTATVPAAGTGAFITASGEAVGFYANLYSLGGATTDAAKRAAYTPQEVWVWTRSIGGKRQLCNQVRPLTRDRTQALVFPSTSLAVESNRTCHVLVADLAPADGTPTFTYLAAADPLGTSGTSTSSIAMSGGVVADTSDVEAVQVRVRALAGTARDTQTVTSAVRITLINKL